MPQNAPSLLDMLLGRQPAPTPVPAQPDTLVQRMLDFQKAQTPPEAPLAGLRPMFEGGVDLVSGVLGMGDETKANLVGQLLSAGLPLAAGVKKIKAFHGSPHDFDKFSMEKIGTGEGAQAYGHGLYFAENPELAAEYRKKLTSGPTPGRTYEVDINADPDTLLDWDAPMDKQTPYVQERLKGIAPTRRTVDSMGREELLKVLQHVDSNGSFTDEMTALEDMDPLTLEDAREIARGMNLDEYLAAKVEGPVSTGQSLYRQMVAQQGGGHTYGGPANAAASAQLNQAGIPGIKYLDGASRTAGEGTRNYTIFDEGLVEMIKKYGLVGALGASLGIGQQDK
jgi:hypothetical protein